MLWAVRNTLVRKKVKRFLVSSCTVIAILLLLFVPFTPKNAVRLSILENLHPFAAVFAFPSKMAKKDSTGYSGKHIAAYYSVLVQVGSDMGGFDTYVIGVKEKKSGEMFYRAELAYDPA